MEECLTIIRFAFSLLFFLVHKNPPSREDEREKEEREGEGGGGPSVFTDAFDKHLDCVAAHFRRPPPLLSNGTLFDSVHWLEGFLSTPLL